MGRKTFLVAVLLLAALALPSCCSAPRQYVEAQIATHALFTEPAPNHPEGYLPTWIDQAEDAGSLTALEANALRLKLRTWDKSNSEALEAVTEAGGED